MLRFSSTRRRREVKSEKVKPQPIVEKAKEQADHDRLSPSEIESLRQLKQERNRIFQAMFRKK
jgi:hypothetical protein